MANKIQTLADFPEFTEVAERLSKLRLRKSGIDEQIKVLATQINKMDMEAENQDVNDLVNNPDVEIFSHKKRDLTSKISELRVEADTLQSAISQVRSQLDGIKSKILPQIAEQFRPQHEKIIREYVTLAGKVYAAHQNNVAFMQEVGAATGLNPSELLPVFHLRTLGAESDGFSFLSLLINKARTSGYRISDMR